MGTGTSRFQVQGINADFKITANAIVRKCVLCAEMTGLTILFHGTTNFPRETRRKRFCLGLQFGNAVHHGAGKVW